ncbi:MAG: serine hydrolase domain-containing protein [Gemmatimonadaceae bacterium]
MRHARPPAAHVVRRSLCLALAFAAGACGGDAGPVATPATGAVALRFGGLPEGASPSAVLAGPNGYSRTIGTPTATVANLTPGTYTLTASAVEAGGRTWYPVGASVPIEVRAGQTVSLRNLYGRVPAWGTFVPSLLPLDSTMLAFMAARGIETGTLAVARAGRPVLSRAYGWRDRAHAHPLSPDALFRLASVSKPVTAAAIGRLIGEGKLSSSTKVYPLLGLAPLGGAVADARIYDVTVRQLLDHKGGWDRDLAGDVVFMARTFARALGASAPLDKTELARYMMTQPLQFAPGARAAYSNFGYSLLGLAIEKVTGQRYVDYVRQNVFPATAAPFVAQSATLPEDRDPREPEYVDPATGCLVFVVASCSVVPIADGWWWSEQFDSFGGLSASAPTLLQFLSAYWLDGSPRPAPGATGSSWWAFGSLPGTFTMARQRPDGTDVVVLFNQRTDPSGLPYDVIGEAMDAAAARVAAWP